VIYQFLLLVSVVGIVVHGGTCLRDKAGGLVLLLRSAVILASELLPHLHQLVAHQATSIMLRGDVLGLSAQGVDVAAIVIAVAHCLLVLMISGARCGSLLLCSVAIEGLDGLARLGTYRLLLLLLLLWLVLLWSGLFIMMVVRLLLLLLLGVSSGGVPDLMHQLARVVMVVVARGASCLKRGCARISWAMHVMHHHPCWVLSGVNIGALRGGGVGGGASCAAAAPVRLVLLDEVLEDADVVRAPVTSVACSTCSIGGGCLGAEDGVHDRVVMVMVVSRGGCSVVVVVVREVSPKLSMRLVVIPSVLNLLLLLHVHEVHLLLGTGGGASDYVRSLPSGLHRRGLLLPTDGRLRLHSCRPVKLDGSEQVLQGLILLVE
jgi:hypothetical protein